MNNMFINDYPAEFIYKARQAHVKANSSPIPTPATRPAVIYVDDILPQQWEAVQREELKTVPDSTLVTMTVHPPRSSPLRRGTAERVNLITNELHRRDVEKFGAVELYSKYYYSSLTFQHMEMLDALHFPFGVNKFPGHKGLYPDGLPLNYPVLGNPHRRVWFWGCWFEWNGAAWVEVEYGTEFLVMFKHLLK